jgi:hypothetical protein
LEIDGSCIDPRTLERVEPGAVGAAGFDSREEIIMRRQAIRWVTCVSSLALSLAIGGCLERDLGELDPKVGRVLDQGVSTGGVTDVDLLLVVDDSTSMREEQELLRREIPNLVRGLTEPPDEDGDGEPDWPAVESLRVAVVTSDMGTNGIELRGLGGCGLDSTLMDPYGPDGRFRQDLSCDPSGSLIQSWQTGENVDAFVDRVGCVANAGIRGCGFEQPLLAGARALSRSAETGFPRDEALLAVLVLTDEEDCSVGDPEAFYADVPVGNAMALNQYCVDNPSLLASAVSLAQDLSAGRDQSGFVFAAITGVPVSVAGESPETILRDPGMEYVFDSTAPLGLRPACVATNDDGTERSNATPARRVVEVAAQIDDALVRSICEDDFRPAIAELTRRIGRELEGVCLDRGLVPAEDGSVDCVVQELLPEGMRCDALPGRSDLGTDPETGRTECLVDQVPGGAGSGWSYELLDGCSEIRFTPDAVPPLGTRVEFKCLVEVPSSEATGA